MMTEDQPLLTICTPTYERPGMLEQALASIVDQAGPGAESVELIVSDNSTSDEPERIARGLLDAWPGPTRYVRNRPAVGMIENHNRCLALASGRNVLFVQDDDRLLPGSLATILATLERPDAGDVHLFGVAVVDPSGRVRRRQVPRGDRVLEPRAALSCLLSRSSFVRLPGLVATSTAYASVGAFDPEARNAIDFDMWVRLFARYGLHTVPHVTAAYTVHAAALTSSMFTPDMVGTLMGIFDRAVTLGVLPQEEVRRCQATWFHQFILAGTYRRLEVRDRAGAAGVMRLFELPEVRRLGLSWRWLPVRVAFGLAVLGARSRSSAGARADPG